MKSRPARNYIIGGSILNNKLREESRGVPLFYGILRREVYTELAEVLLSMTKYNKRKMTKKSQLKSEIGFTPLNAVERQFRPKRNYLTGFTLIELLVGMGIFLLMFGMLVSVLVFQSHLQRKALAQQEILAQLSFTMEYMSRALRMAAGAEDDTCLDIGFNYENPEIGNSSIRFINHLQGDDCQEFFLEDQALKYKKDAGGVNEVFPLTSPKIRIDELQFRLLGESEEDNIQPRVVIFLKASPVNFDYPITLQTSISQRALDEAR